MHSLSQAPSFQSVTEHIPEFKAILWDMDGTILNTERLHYQSILHCLGIKQNGQELEKFCLGNTDQEIFKHLKGDTNMTLEQFLDAKEVSFQRLVRESNIDDLVAPAIKKFISELKSKGIKQMVVTSSERVTTEFLLKHVSLFDMFDDIICREDTAENKPSPMPYQLAMSKLGMDGQEVVIFEDSQMGLKAAGACSPNIFQAKWY